MSAHAARALLLEPFGVRLRTLVETRWGIVVSNASPATTAVWQVLLVRLPQRIWMRWGTRVGVPRHRSPTSELGLL
jgi:hypothetical protein